MCHAVLKKNLPTNELPMYGLKGKSKAQLDADKEFLRLAEQSGRSRQNASRHAARRGFETVRKGDLATAAKRFNQAWLLDAGNGEAYWGFGILADARDHDIDCARAFFERALKIMPNDSDLLVDYGRMFGRNGRHSAVIAPVEKALRLRPETRDAHRLLSIAYFHQGDFRKSLNHAETARNQGDDEIKSEFVVFLTCAIGKLDAGVALPDATAACKP